MLREMALEAAGFSSAQDADTEGVEGLTFTWARGEGAPGELLEPFEHGRFVLRGELDEETRARLFELRELRPKPLRDDKAITSWNGLVLAALSGARAFDRARDWLAAAERLCDFLLGPLSTTDGRLYRTWREGVAKGTGYLSDYADVAYGLLELHVATGDPAWLLTRVVSRRPRSTCSPTPSAAASSWRRATARLAARPKEIDDDPTPSGNSMFASLLIRLGRIWGDDELTSAVRVFFAWSRPQWSGCRARSRGRSSRSTSTSPRP